MAVLECVEWAVDYAKEKGGVESGCKKGRCKRAEDTGDPLGAMAVPVSHEAAFHVLRCATINRR